KGAARLTGRRSFHAQALSPCRRIHAGITGGAGRPPPAARWRHFYLMELTLSPDDKRQLSHWLSLSCRPHKFSINLTLKGSFQQAPLGCLKRIFLAGLGPPRALAAIAAPAPPKSQNTAAGMLYGFA